MRRASSSEIWGSSRAAATTSVSFPVSSARRKRAYGFPSLVIRTYVRLDAGWMARRRRPSVDPVAQTRRRQRGFMLCTAMWLAVRSVWPVGRRLPSWTVSRWVERNTRSECRDPARFEYDEERAQLTGRSMNKCLLSRSNELRPVGLTARSASSLAELGRAGLIRPSSGLDVAPVRLPLCDLTRLASGTPQRRPCSSPDPKEVSKWR